MARELTMNGNAKLKTIMKEFNERFPYLQICIFPLTEKDKSTKSPHNFEKTISEVREKKSSTPVKVRGGQKARNLEKMMEKHFGLYCEVCYYKDGKGYWTSSPTYNEMSLRELNKYGEENGWDKDKWH